MTPDRWRQVENLCHAALACAAGDRAAFLAKACAGDDALQREVASLLAQEPNAEGFMSAPAAVLAGPTILDHVEDPLVGRRLGVYAIRALLGVGGMGAVYRAHDDTLGREVAIKVLPAEFTADPERRARFEREARMLAALNHPHIGAIYGVEEGDGVRGLILELVDGETLAERIARAPGLAIADVLAIGRQIADALDAAHEKGIVHRDLKPANIKIRPDGAVKVLDFGLAKAASVEGAGPVLRESRDGAIMGTAAYMSPEQARGQSVDKRGDVWAFGCVLYEMLTGLLAFPGETVSDTIAKILEREPDWSALPAATPAAIRRLLLRCLAKDPRQRLRDIGDARLEIDGISNMAPGPPGDAVVSPVSTGPGRTWLLWLAVAALAATVGVREASRPVMVQESPLVNARFTPFTDWEGTEGLAEISPDGRFVTFLSDRDGQFDIWLSQVGTGEFRNLTNNLPSLNPPGVVLRSFGFSGDAAKIWFSLSGNPGDRKMLMPLLGGKPWAFLGAGDVTPSWSPDGTRIAYVNNRNGDPLFVADEAGADARQILAPQNGVLHNHDPVWSPDSQWIYFVRGLEPTDEMDIWRIRPSGGSPERMTALHAAVNFLAPIDADTVLFVARPEDRSGPWLWALDVATRHTHRVSWGLEQYTSLAASRDGRRIVATVANPRGSLWSAPILDRPAQDGDIERFPVSTVRALAPRFAGTSLFYLAAGGNGHGLWRFDAGQASEIWRGIDGTLSEPPTMSPDGTRVAVVVGRHGKRQLTIMSADGTNARTLATSIDLQGAAGQSTADWSADGTWLVAGGSDGQGPGLFKIPADAAPPVRLLAGQATNPVRSPEGNLIVYTGAFVGGQALLQGMRPDGVPVNLPRVNVRQGGYRFLPDGKGLVYLPNLQSRDFWLLDLATKNQHQLTRLSDQGNLATFDITPDGKHIVFDRSRENSDIVLIDLPK